MSFSALLYSAALVREQATHKPDKPLPELSSLDDLPDDLKTELNKLCVLAYNGVMQNKIVFYSRDLPTKCNLSSLGLLQAVEGLTLYSKSLSYNFLHLSVQELLAAYNISLMDPSEQVKVFKELFESSRFEAVLQYYSGFTKLDNPDIQEFISSYQHGKSHLQDLLPLLQCFFEARRPSLCQLVDPRFDPNELCCDSLTPVDHLTVGYFITSLISTSTSRMSRVSLSYQSTNDQDGLKLLLSELSKHPMGVVSRKITLDLSGISKQGAKHIASHLKQSSAITNLKMTECDGVLHIVEALQTNSSLTELYLINSIPEFAEQISSVFFKMLPKNQSLKHLEVSRKDYLYLLDDSALSRSATVIFHSILEGLQCNTSLVNLSLLDYKITATDPDIARSLTKMLQLNKSLTHLDLAWNSLSDTGAKCIFEGLQHNTTLVNLSLWDNSIRADTAGSLTKMLHENKSLTHLDLSRNGLFDSGARCIFEGLQHNTALVNLSLQNNHITAADPDTARSLTKMLQENKSLTHLDLLNNRVSDSGARCIFEVLQHNTTLVKLSLGNNNITATDPDTIKFLTKTLKANKSLTYLDMSDNPFENGKIPCIFQGLKHNTTLLYLKLHNTGITDGNAEYIGQALKSNCFLRTLDITGNSSLSDIGTFLILDSLMSNTTLKELYAIIKLEIRTEFHRARRDMGLSPIDIRFYHSLNNNNLGNERQWSGRSASLFTC